MLELHESLEVDHFNMEKEKTKCLRSGGGGKKSKNLRRESIALVAMTDSAKYLSTCPSESM